MSDVWSKMIKELGKFGDTFAEKSEVYIRKAVDKGEELSKLGKIQLEIETTRRELKRKHEALGCYVTDKNRSENVFDFTIDESFKKQIQSISVLTTLIKKLEKDKQKIRGNGKEKKTKDQDYDHSSNPEFSPTEEEDFQL